MPLPRTVPRPMPPMPMPQAPSDGSWDQQPSDESWDLDCEDIGEEVDIDGYDPNNLDADGDGVGCEGW